MKKIFDCHIHINLLSQNPINDLIEQLDRNSIEKALLIINRSEENEILKNNYNLLEKKLKSRLLLAVCVDLKQDNIWATTDFWRNNGWHVYTKLHPRITNITYKDFNDVCRIIEDEQSGVVIVDCLGYGPNIENHVGVELGVLLAKEFSKKKIVFAHSGGERLLQCLLYTRSLSNAFFDLSLSCNYFFGSSVTQDIIQLIKFNKEKTMYGSDYPDFYPEQAIEKVNILCNKAGLTENDTQKIFFDNAEKVYGKKLQ